MIMITEGRTRLIVPESSLSDIVPSRHTVFFNPRAGRTRDISILACKAHAIHEKSDTYLDAMTGVGARGVRVAVESDYDTVYVNDSSPQAIHIARECAALNDVYNVKFSVQEACRFLMEHSGRGARGDVVDIDPFGSPAPHMDCAIRATKYNGMLAMTATDLQVLGGLHNKACQRIYGGMPLKTVYHAEISIRLILGCLAQIAGRLGAGIAPLYVESHMHYYRVYAKMLSTPIPESVGCLAQCMSCGSRGNSDHYGDCSETKRIAGPLWVGRIFDSEFVRSMAVHNDNDTYTRHLQICYDEADMPSTFYTSDEIASKIRSGPPPLKTMISALRDAGFTASYTSFSPTGFRTHADITDVCGVMARAGQ